MEQETLELPPISFRDKVESLKALKEIYELSREGQVHRGCEGSEVREVRASG